MFAEAKQEEEDEEFIVHKAGPPLPIRRAKTNKKSHHYPLPSSSLNEIDIIEDNYNPQVQIILKPPLTTPVFPTSSPTPVLSNNQIKTIHPIHQTSSIPRPNLKIKNETFQSPQPVVVKSRPQTPTHQVESKVRQYIEKVKKFDEENRAARIKPDKYLSLEDLYQISKEEDKKCEEGIQDRLRQTQRIIKEKDEQILRLRESCLELKLKWADAQNRIDEMRFGIGINGNVKRLDSETNIITRPPIRSVSVMNLATLPRDELEGSNWVKDQKEVEEIKREMKDQATETEIETRKEKVLDLEAGGMVLKLLKSETTEEDFGDEFDLDDLASQFDPVLEEKCSHWMEKVQNWKTDSALNLSQDKDSCGDRDSGFRSEIEVHHCQGTRKTACVPCGKEACRHSLSHKVSKSNGDVKRSSKTTRVSKSQEKDNKEVVITVGDSNLLTSISKSPTPERTFNLNPLPFDLSRICAQEGSSSMQKEEDDSAPSSLQIAQPWLQFNHVNPQSATEYEGFPSFTSSYQSQQSNQNSPAQILLRKYRLSSAKSMEALHTTAEVGAKDNYYKLLKSLDRRFRMINPLLDDATSAVLRVKYKSEKLTKILQKETEGLKDLREQNKNKRQSLA